MSGGFQALVTEWDDVVASITALPTGSDGGETILRGILFEYAAKLTPNINGLASNLASFCSSSMTVVKDCIALLPTGGSGGPAPGGSTGGSSAGKVCDALFPAGVNFYATVTGQIGQQINQNLSGIHSGAGKIVTAIGQVSGNDDASQGPLFTLGQILQMSISNADSTLNQAQQTLSQMQSQLSYDESHPGGPGWAANMEQIYALKQNIPKEQAYVYGVQSDDKALNAINGTVSTTQNLLLDLAHAMDTVSSVLSQEVEPDSSGNFLTKYLAIKLQAVCMALQELMAVTG